MPEIQVTTKSANQVWSSPDGQRKIYELQLDYQGKPVTAKTYSDAIAVVGWAGTVETYEKTGRNGIETFVKQPPKEGGSYPSGGRSGGSKPQADPFTMYLSYAKDIAVALIGSKAYSPERLSEIVAAVSLAGEQLYDARPDGPTRQAEAAPEVKPDKVAGVPDGPIDTTLIDEIFSGDDETQEELPWPPK